jgi:hypothetical protein
MPIGSALHHIVILPSRVQPNLTQRLISKTIEGFIGAHLPNLDCDHYRVTIPCVGPARIRDLGQTHISPTSLVLGFTHDYVPAVEPPSIFPIQISCHSQTFLVSAVEFAQQSLSSPQEGPLPSQTPAVAFPQGSRRLTRRMSAPHQTTLPTRCGTQHHRSGRVCALIHSCLGSLLVTLGVQRGA